MTALRYQFALWRWRWAMFVHVGNAPSAIGVEWAPGEYRKAFERWLEATPQRPELPA